MSKVQMLRALVEQRLTAAAEEIFGLFERTIAEYEEELSRSTEEKERQRKLLDAVFKPEVRLHRADVQQLLVSKEEVPPEQQDRSSSLDQEDPELPHIKEEPEEVWTSQEGEQLQELEEADITKFPFTPVPVKSEDDEEKPQSSQLHQRHTEQMETEADGEDCGGPELARNSDPDRHLQPDTDDKTENSSETEDSDDDWKATRKPHSGLKTRITGEKLLLFHSCSECGKGFGNKTNLKVHMRTHTGENSFSCLVCGKIFTQGGNLRQHMAVHTGERRLRCSVCYKRFTWYKQFKTHKCVGIQPSQLLHRQTEQLETGADGGNFGGPEPARISFQPDTDDKTENSSEPETEDSDADWKETREPQSGLKTLKNNEVPVSDMRYKTGEKLFSCSECGKRFGRKTHLKTHMMIHTGEKPFSCSVCGKRFIQKGSLTRHMACHTGEKPFSCRVCDKRFIWLCQLKKHKCVGESQLHQNQTEQREIGADGEDCGGSEPVRNSDPDRHLQPDTDNIIEDSSEPETDDSDDD